jgi:hypothetical protein
MFLHFVASALPGNAPLSDPAAAWWLMGRLRIGFPQALVTCLMPTHVHLLGDEPDADEGRLRLARVLAHLTARMGRKHLFQPVPPPAPVLDRKHLARQMRYVHLNPCRDGLVSDPMCWPWSTHRALVGAEIDPWLDIKRLASALRRPERGFAEWAHQYISGDPSVNVCGSPLPRACPPRELPVHPLETIRRAALAATPWSEPRTRRRLIVELAYHQGWTDVELLARAAGTSTRSVRRFLAELGDRAPSRAALVCLGDPRLQLAEHQLRPMIPVAR